MPALAKPLARRNVRLPHQKISKDIDLAKAETDPSSSIRGVAAADCATVRLSLSPDGRSVWATDRGSNTLTQLDANAIAASSQSAKTASIPVGSNPVPLLATRDGRYVLVGNTNRFGAGGTTEGSSPSSMRTICASWAR